MNLRKLILTENECYKIGTKIKPCGVMVHSTAANNPWLKRYVGPDDGYLGQNQYNNHWNTFRPGGRQVCVHGFIGKLKDGTIATYQTLPWDMKGWHAGGSANSMGYIGFEICEDGLTDAVYFGAVYKEAVEFVAYLCKEYKLNPLTPGIVICHQEGYRRGIASNHADVFHWFPKFGKSMDDFRNDVYETMKEDDEMLSYEQWKAYMDQYRKELGSSIAADYAKPFIKDCIDAGIMVNTGTPESPSIDRPGDLLTRQEAAVMQALTMKAMKK